MSKTHIFLSIFSKIAIFVCVFCAVPAWSETTCDIDYTPVTGNSWQNGTPTPTNPVEIESVGTKVGNKYAVQIAINNGGGVVDLGTLNWSYDSVYDRFLSQKSLSDLGIMNNNNVYLHGYRITTSVTPGSGDKIIATNGIYVGIRDERYTDVNAFKSAMSGKMLYYQRATDETWTAPTLRTIYLDEPLRKVGDYADVLDYKNGTITRNVGVKVLDGTENWSKNASGIFTTNIASVSQKNAFCTHYKKISDSTSLVNMTTGTFKNHSSLGNVFYFADARFEDIASFKSWLAQQYTNGTPVTVYYPLATPVVEQIENWSCIPPITDIQIATTKFVDDEFAVAEANLATTVQTIESVVSRTIAQTGQIQVLQDTKQTRPDENCPANMKCLLVQDEDGTPHWYPIIEP
ncbi:MAG: hypothetical protein KBT14_04205 [Proteobacteria bacterium]|nr:hypothetical protein [Candidatus Enterousia onthequi]